MDIREIEFLTTEERNLLALAVSKSPIGIAIWQSPDPHNLSAELTLRYINFLGAGPSGKHPRDLIEKSMKSALPELVGTELDLGLHKAIHLQNQLEVVVHTKPSGGGQTRSFRNHITPVSSDVVVASFSEITKEVMLERDYRIERRTNLASRAYFDDCFIKLYRELKESKNGETLGFIFFDLDNFKGINDAHGHITGDLVLSEVARRLRAIQPIPAVISHWGGDEFAIITNFSAEDNRRIVEKVLAIFVDPYRIEDVVVHISASIGFRTISTANLISRENLMLSVDQVMYLAKERGGSQSQEAT